MKWSQPADRRVVEAVVASFREPSDGLYAILLPLTARQWEQSLHWLDASGMALYFLDRLQRLDLTGTLPRTVLARLRCNLEDNRARTDAMFAQFVQLNTALAAAGVAFCNLKGLSLPPESCPDPGLRRQLDFDLLVDGRDLGMCRNVLERYGYVLRGAGPRVWEFKSEATGLADIRDFYRQSPQRCVEVHFAIDPMTGNPLRDQRLDRAQTAERRGFSFPALPPEDQLIGQATHLLEHLCGPCTRLAWLLEFRRHIAAHFDDRAFWRQVLDRSAETAMAETALGISLLLVEDLFEAEIPPALAASIQRLPEGVRRWTKDFGSRAVLADFPGSKLYLLLREQLHGATPAWAGEKRSALLPVRRAPRIIYPGPNQTLLERLQAESVQLQYDLFRLRFHVVEGVRYAIEAARWRRTLDRQRPQAAMEAASASESIVRS